MQNGAATPMSARKFTRLNANDPLKKSIGPTTYNHESYQSQGPLRASMISRSNNAYNTNRGSEIPDLNTNNTHLENEGFAIYSNVKFLFIIGKICAETGKKLEDGLKALNDYIMILDFYRYDIS